MIFNDSHCFELYGFDILIDDDLKPLLIEINASPSLSHTTIPDKKLKKGLINDLLNIVIPSKFNKYKKSKNKEKQVGGFDLLYDQSLDKLNSLPSI